MGLGIISRQKKKKVALLCAYEVSHNNPGAGEGVSISHRRKVVKNVKNREAYMKRSLGQNTSFCVEFSQELHRLSLKPVT